MPDAGATDSIALAAGAFRTGVQTLINEALAPLSSRIVLMTGNLDGVGTNGRITYLAGHDYSLDLPISANPKTNGVRLLLNALLASVCATTEPQADMTVAVSAPAETNTDITYTLTYANPGARAVEHVRLVDPLPAGTSFSSATGGGTHGAGVVTWNLGTVAAGASGSVTVTVAKPARGQYTNTPEIRFAHTTVRRVVATPAVTDVGVRRVAAPATFDLGSLPTGAHVTRSLTITNPARRTTTASPSRSTTSSSPAATSP